MGCCLLSTPCDLCTCTFYSCYIQRFRRRCIYKRIHYLTFGPKVTQNVAQYPLHHVTYSAAKFEVVTSNGLGDAFTRKYIIWVTRNVAQYPLHHVTNAATKFEVATANGLGGEIITINRTYAHTNRWTTDQLWYKINKPFFSKEKSGYKNPWSFSYNSFVKLSFITKLTYKHSSFLWTSI